MFRCEILSKFCPPYTEKALFTLNRAKYAPKGTHHRVRREKPYPNCVSPPPGSPSPLRKSRFCDMTFVP